MYNKSTVSCSDLYTTLESDNAVISHRLDLLAIPKYLHELVHFVALSNEQQNTNYNFFLLTC